MLQGPPIINPEEQEIAKREIIARSDAKFDALEEWIAKRLSRYIPKNKKH
ncbi:hypothetical protein DGo_PC0029 (plasmid) [Deinococcus gobiensis I-0]|uniref:Uncharacterized protein n=2 Tax=Deinococcus TaxID=1298 RepID=H8H2S4_DEIGI|nr:hypothetical protein DGo_PC0029 [Deinococcus gobiensis I-0]